MGRRTVKSVRLRGSENLNDNEKTVNDTLREKCPNTEFFLVRIFLYSVRIQENTDHKKLRIWTLFTQCILSLKKSIQVFWQLRT